MTKGFIGGLNHNWSQPIGKPLEANIDAKGLFCKARISDTTHGRDVRVLIKDGVITQLSIGFITQGYEWLDTAEEVEAYWKKYDYTPSSEDIARAQYGALLKTRVKLYEYSPVTVPANSLCDITDVRGEDGESARAALSTDDHIQLVLAANNDVLSRLKSIAEKRADDGRNLSQQRCAQIRQMRDAFDELLTLAQTPAAQPTEDAEARAASSKRIHDAQLLQFEADLLRLN